MRAITKNTRRVTALTLAAALVVAVYLNWQYARTGIGVDEEAVTSRRWLWRVSLWQHPLPMADDGGRSNIQCQQELWGGPARQRGQRRRRKIL